MKCWVVIILLAVAIIPFVLKADVVDKMLFSNKKYAKQIEVKTYILTQDQVVELFKYPDKEPVQLTVNDLEKITNITKKRYFIVRVKNLGQSHAWGILNCKIPNISLPINIPVIKINKDYCDYLICLSGIAIFQENNDLPPNIRYEWSELYTK